LGLATDGVNPFGENNNAWSISPVFFLNYNLPRTLAGVQFFFLVVINDNPWIEQCEE
jgi:hypothetical protein